MKPAHPLAIGSICLMVGAFANTSHAVSRFPSLIYHDLYANYKVTPYQPPCSICHERGSTGPGTAQTPFALSMKAYGLTPSDSSSVTKALDGLAHDNVDSDGDGIPDVEEIENDTDRNTPANVTLTGEPGPNAGCGGGQKAGRGGKSAPALAISLLTLIGLFRRKDSTSTAR